jgi:hypothetical protein
VDLVLLNFEVSESKSVTPHSLGPLLTSDRPITETTHITHKRQISIAPSGFEPAIPARKRPETRALDRAATSNQMLDHTLNECLEVKTINVLLSPSLPIQLPGQAHTSPTQQYGNKLSRKENCVSGACKSCSYGVGYTYSTPQCLSCGQSTFSHLFMICVIWLQPSSSNLQYDSSLISFKHISNKNNVLCQMCHKYRQFQPK